MGGLIKLAAPELNNPMVVFLRNLAGLLILSPLLLRWGARGLATSRAVSHLTRALLGVSAMYCFFYAITHLTLAEAMLLNYSTPLFIPFIAWAWLGERPPAVVYPAVLLGFVGVAMILKPGPGLISSAGLVGLAAGLLAASAMTNIRYMADTEPVTRIVFYFAVFATLLSAAPALAAWQTPSPRALALMALVGLSATLGQLFLTRAYALAPAARVGSLIYSAVVFAAMLDWLFWDARPDGWSVIGTLLIVAAGMLASRMPAPKTA
jgi:drug/metabolite transporter (DMT)-like permease